MNKDLRNFGLTLGAIFAGLGMILYFRHQPHSIYFLVISLLLLIPALVLPQILKPIDYFWTKLSTALSWLMTRLVLIILFYLVFTPTALLLKLLHKDLLNLKIDKAAPSYWLKKTTRLDKTNLLKQY